MRGEVVSEWCGAHAQFLSGITRHIYAVRRKTFQPGDTVLHILFLVFHCAQQPHGFVNQDKSSFNKFIYRVLGSALPRLLFRGIDREGEHQKP